MGAAGRNDGVSQGQVTVPFLPSIIQTPMNAFAWLIWLLLGLVSAVPKTKENILSTRYLRWVKSSAGVQRAVGFCWGMPGVFPYSDLSCLVCSHPDGWDGSFRDKCTLFMSSPASLSQQLYPKLLWELFSVPTITQSNGHLSDDVYGRFYTSISLPPPSWAIPLPRTPPGNHANDISKRSLHPRLLHPNGVLSQVLSEWPSLSPPDDQVWNLVNILAPTCSFFSFII